MENNLKELLQFMSEQDRLVIVDMITSGYIAYKKRNTKEIISFINDLYHALIAIQEENK